MLYSIARLKKEKASLLARLDEHEYRILMLESQLAKYKLKCAMLDDVNEGLTGISGELYIAKILKAEYVGFNNCDYDVLVNKKIRIEVKTTGDRGCFFNITGRRRKKVYDYLVGLQHFIRKGIIVKRFFVVSYDEVLGYFCKNVRADKLGKEGFEVTQNELIELFAKI